MDAEHRNPAPPTLVVGGTGKTGRRVVTRLHAAGVPVRIGSRSAERPFRWEDESTWMPVLEGVESMYVTHHTDLAFPGAADDVRRLADAAVAAGVRKIVLLSGRNEEGAERGEEAVQASGAEWTLVRSSFFAQNFSEFFLLDEILAGVVAFPAGNVLEPFVDLEDIADVAAAALIDDAHVGQLYEVTGPRLLTFGDAVAEIAAATGRELRYLPITLDEYGAAMREAGMPAELAALYVDLFTEILDGRSSYLADGVQRALGREPHDFADFARTAAAAGVWDVPANSTEGVTA